MTSTVRPGRRELPWLIAFSILTLVTALSVWYPVIRTFARFEINTNEGWNAYRAAMADRGVPLYGEAPGFTVTNYPPLSFHVVAILGRVTGDVLATGRFLSLLSLGLIALLAAATVRLFAGRWNPGLYAAFGFVIWIASFQPDRIGMDDPQLFAMVFSLLGLYAYVRRPDSNRWLCASAIALAVSLFTKHNLLAFPFSVGAHLLLTRSFRRFAVWAGTLAGASIALLLVTLAVDGRYLFAHLTGARPYLMTDLVEHIGRYMWTLQLPLAAALLWCIWNCTHASRNLLAIALVAAHAIAFGFSGGHGVDGNIFFDCILVVVIITGIAANDLADVIQNRRFGNLIFAAVLLAPFLGVAATLPAKFVQDYRGLRAIPALEEEFAQAVSFVAAEPGPVYCRHLLICFEAGKPDEIDTFIVADRFGTGRLTDEEFWNMVDTRRFDAMELQTAADGLVSPFPPADFLNRLAERYRPAMQAGRIGIVVRKDGSPR